jgi:hypothetical protein
LSAWQQQDRPENYRQTMEKSEGRLTPDVVSKMSIGQLAALGWTNPERVTMGWGEFLQTVVNRKRE